MNVAGVLGPKARHVIAWAGVRAANGGPGTASQKPPQGLKGRNNFTPPVPPFQGGEDLFRMFTWGFTPGYHMTGFQPSEQRRTVAEADALATELAGLQAEVDALKRLQIETAAELDALLPALLDGAFKGEL